MKQQSNQKKGNVSNNWADVSDDGDEYYTEEEEKMLDKYLKATENKIAEEEIYEIMLKHNNVEVEVMDELMDMLKNLNKGKEYDWQEIGSNGKVKKEKPKKDRKLYHKNKDKNKEQEQEQTNDNQTKEYKNDKKYNNYNNKGYNNYSYGYGKNSYYNKNYRYNKGYYGRYNRYNNYGYNNRTYYKKKGNYNELKEIEVDSTNMTDVPQSKEISIQPQENIVSCDNGKDKVLENKEEKVEYQENKDINDNYNNDNNECKDNGEIVTNGKEDNEYKDKDDKKESKGNNKYELSHSDLNLPSNNQQNKTDKISTNQQQEQPTDNSTPKPQTQQGSFMNYPYVFPMMINPAQLQQMQMYNQDGKQGSPIYFVPVIPQYDYSKMKDMQNMPNMANMATMPNMPNNIANMTPMMGYMPYSMPNMAMGMPKGGMGNMGNQKS